TALLVLIFVSASPVPAGDAWSIGNYRLVETHHVSATHDSFTYSASLRNSGRALTAVSATVSSDDPSIQAGPANGMLTFVPIPANGQAASSNTFTILVDRRVPFDFSKLKWTFRSTAPIAYAGRNRTAKVGSTVQLNGADSISP